MRSCSYLRRSLTDEIQFWFPICFGGSFEHNDTTHVIRVRWILLSIAVYLLTCKCSFTAFSLKSIFVYLRKGTKSIYSTIASEILFAFRKKAIELFILNPRWALCACLSVCVFVCRHDSSIFLYLVLDATSMKLYLVKKIAARLYREYFWHLRKKTFLCRWVLAQTLTQLKSCLFYILFVYSIFSISSLSRRRKKTWNNSAQL